MFFKVRFSFVLLSVLSFVCAFCGQGHCWSDPVSTQVMQSSAGSNGYFLSASQSAKSKTEISNAIQASVKTIKSNPATADMENAFGQLKNIGSAAVPELVKLLDYSSYEIKTPAAFTLGEIKDPAAVPGLVKQLDYTEKDSEFRYHVYSALSSIGEAAIPALSDIVKYETNPFTKQTAVFMLGCICDDTISNHLSSSFAEKIVPVFSVLNEALTKSNSGSEEAIIWSMATIYNKPLSQLGSGVKDKMDEVVRANLTGNNYVVFERTLKLLSRMYPPEAQGLIGSVIDRNPELSSERKDALVALRSSCQEKFDADTGTSTRTGVYIDWRFSPEETVFISDTLSAFEPGLFNGLHRIDYSPVERYFYNIDRAASYSEEQLYSGGNITITFNPEVYMKGKLDFASAICHEIGHFIDDKYNNKVGTGTLYPESSSNYIVDALNNRFSWMLQGSDFSRSYGKTNAWEDFATVFEDYCVNSEDAFVKGVAQAKSGDDTYLKKVLLCFNLLDHANNEYFYKIGDNGVITRQAWKPAAYQFWDYTGGKYNLEVIENYDFSG